MCQKSFLFFFGNVKYFDLKTLLLKKPFFQHIYQNVTKPSAKSVYCFTLEVTTTLYLFIYLLCLLPLKHDAIRDRLP